MNLIPHPGERGLTEFRPARLPTTAPPPPPRPFFDIFRLLSILRRRARLIALVFAAVFLAVLLPALAEPKLVCGHCGEPLHPHDVTPVAASR